MGFFGKLIGDALGQVVSETVGKVVKDAIAPHAEQNSANEKQNVAGEQSVPQSGLAGALSRLQSAIAEADSMKNAEGIQECQRRWDAMLPHYPKWDMPAKSMSIENHGKDENGHSIYSVDIEVESEEEMEGLQYIYRRKLQDAGFHTAGKYPDESQYYKRIFGTVYHVDLEHWYENDTVICIVFNNKEPEGGYDYNPTDTRSQKGLFDILKDSL